MKRYSLMLLMLMLVCVDLSAQDFMWAKQIASTSTNPNYGPRAAWIEKDAAGNIYLAGGFGGTVDFDPGPGTFNLTAGPGNDYYILKLDSNGDFIWALQFTDGTGDIVPYDMTVDGVGNIYVTGYFTLTADFDPGVGIFNLISNGNDDIFITKIDPDGNFVWAKQMGGNLEDAGVSVVISDDNNVYVTGNFRNTVDFNPGSGVYNLNSVGSADLFVLKLDNTGDFVWAYSEGTIGSDLPKSICLDDAGNIIVAVIVSNHLTMLKINPQGNYLWSKQITTDQVMHGVVSSRGQDLVLTGLFDGVCDFDPSSNNYNLTSVNGSDIFVLKLDTAANFIWARQLSCTGYAASAGKPIIDGAGSIYLGGVFHETCDFDPGSQQYSLTAVPDNPYFRSDIFILKLNSGGNFLNVKQIGNPESDLVSELIFDNDQNILLSGSFKDTLDVDPNAGIHELTTPGSVSSYVLKLSSPLNVPTTYSNTPLTNIYPNPASGMVTVTSNQPMKKILVTDILGRIMQQVTASGISVSLNLDVQPGLYYVTVITNEGRSSTQKLVINNK